MSYIVYLGPKNMTYSAEAYRKLAKKFAGPLPSDQQVVVADVPRNNEIVDKVCLLGGWGVLPMDTKAGGRIDPPVNSLIQLINRRKFSLLDIAGAGVMDISFSLLGNEASTLATIQRVYAHERALDACKQSLQERQIEGVPCDSNGSAIALVRDSDDTAIAALGPKEVGLRQGLVAHAIELEDKKAATTFFYLSQRDHQPPKVSYVRQEVFAVFRIKDTPGALCKVLALLWAGGVNHTMLHSLKLEPGYTDFAIRSTCPDAFLKRRRSSLGWRAAYRVMEECVFFGPFPIVKI